LPVDSMSSHFVTRSVTDFCDVDPSFWVTVILILQLPNLSPLTREAVVEQFCAVVLAMVALTFEVFGARRPTDVATARSVNVLRTRRIGAALDVLFEDPVSFASVERGRGSAVERDFGAGDEALSP